MTGYDNWKVDSENKTKTMKPKSSLTWRVTMVVATGNATLTESTTLKLTLMPPAKLSLIPRE